MLLEHNEISGEKSANASKIQNVDPGSEIVRQGSHLHCRHTLQTHTHTKCAAFVISLLQLILRRGSRTVHIEEAGAPKSILRRHLNINLAQAKRFSCLHMSESQSDLLPISLLLEVTYVLTWKSATIKPANLFAQIHSGADANLNPQAQTH